MPGFRDATAPRQIDSHTYRIDLDGDWVIGTVPHGGYVTSCIQRVVEAHFATTLKAQRQPHPLTMHVEFPRRTSVGPATFRVRDVKLGRKVTTVHVTLEQDGREEVIAYVNQADLRAERGLSFATTWAVDPRPCTPPDFAKLRRDEDEHWGMMRVWPNLKFRKATQHMDAWFPRGGQPGPACLDMWYRLRDDGQRFTTTTLGFVCDSFPQMVERLMGDGVGPYVVAAKPGQDVDEAEQRRRYQRLPSLWYPTLVLNLEVKKALSEEGVEFLFQRVQAKRIHEGRYDLEVLILDADGDLVATSHHVVFVLGAERNQAARRKGGADKGSNL